MRRLAALLIIAAAVAVAVAFAQTYDPPTYGPKADGYGVESYPGHVLSRYYVKASMMAPTAEVDDPIITVRSKLDSNHTIRFDAAYLEGSGDGSAIARTIVWGDTASADQAAYSHTVDFDSVTGDWSFYEGDTIEVWVRVGDALAYNKKFSPPTPDETAPAISDTANFMIVLNGNALPCSVYVDGTADESVTWTLEATYASSYPQYKTPAGDLYTYKTASVGDHSYQWKTTGADVDGIALEIGPRAYHTDTLTAIELIATDGGGNADTLALIDSAYPIVMPLGTVPTANTDGYRLAGYDADASTPEQPETNAEIADWAKMDVILHTHMGLLGGSDTDQDWSRWLSQVREEAGSRNQLMVAHGGEYIVENSTSDFSTRQYDWAKALYDSLMAAESDDTLMFAHSWGGVLLEPELGDAGEGDGFLMNLTNSFGRDRWAKFYAIEWNHADNRLPYTGWLYDVWEPWSGFRTDYPDTSTFHFVADLDRDGIALRHDEDEQWAYRNGMIAYFDTSRHWISATNPDSVVDYFILGGNSDYAWGDSAFSANMDFFQIEDFMTGPMYTGTLGDYPYHDAADSTWTASNLNGNFRLDNSGQWPTPDGQGFDFFHAEDYGRTDAGGPWIMPEMRNGSTIGVRYSTALEVYSLLFDYLYPVYSYPATWSRRYFHPEDHGLSSLEPIGTATGAADLDSTWGFWRISRDFTNGSAVVYMDARGDYNTGTDTLEYMAEVGGDTVRLSDGWYAYDALADDDGPLISTFDLVAYDSSGAGGAYRVAVSVETDETSLIRVRTGTSAGNLSSATWETLVESGTGGASYWHDTGISPFTGTLYGQISAIDQYDNESTELDDIAVARLDQAAPTITAADSSYMVADSLAYAAAIADEEWYQFYRTRIGLAGEWADTTKSDTTLAAGDTARFYYDVLASQDGDTLWWWIGGRDADYNESDPIYISTVLEVNAAPAAPTGLTATASDDVTPPAKPTGEEAVALNGEIAVGWDENTEEDLSHYHIYRGTASGDLTRLPVSLLEPAYEDTDVVAGTTYYYAITAVDDKGNESEQSDEVSKTAWTADNSAPAAPTGLTAEQTQE